MSAPLHPPLRTLLGGIALGLVALMAGIALAERFLPEWRAGAPPSHAALRQRFGELVAKAGMTLDAGEPQIVLTTRGPEQFEPYRELGDAGTPWLLATRTALRATVVEGSATRRESACGWRSTSRSPASPSS